MNHHLTGRQDLKLSDTFNNRQPPNSIFHMITHVFRNCLPGQHFPKLLNISLDLVPHDTVLNISLDLVPHDTGFQNNTETQNNNTYNITKPIYRLNNYQWLYSLYNYPYTLIQNIFKYHLPQVGTHSTWFLQYQSSNTI